MTMNSTNRPNILHLFTDMQRFDTIGALGNPVIRTPALEEHKAALFSFLREGGETAGLDGDQCRRFPIRRVDEDPDAGLLIQDSYTPWVDMTIPGYTDYTGCTEGPR